MFHYHKPRHCEACDDFRCEFVYFYIIRRFKSWKLSTSDTAELLWSLAHSRHASPKLADIEGGLLRQGGLGRCKPSEVSTILWALATLGRTPRALLGSLPAGWQASAKARCGGRLGPAVGKDHKLNSFRRISLSN